MSELRWYILLIGLVILAWIYITGRRQQKAEKHDVFKDIKESPSDVLLDQHQAETSTVAPKTDDAPEPVDEVQGFREALASLKERLPTVHREHETNPRSEPVIQTENEQQFLDTLNGDTSFDKTFNTPAELLEEDKPPFDERPSSEAAAEENLQLELEPEREEIKIERPPQVIVMYVVAQNSQPFSGRAVLKAFHAHKLLFGEQDIFHRFAKYGTERETVFSVANMFKPGTLVQKDLIHGDVKGLSLFMQIPGPRDPMVAFNEMLHCAQHLATTLNGELRDDTVKNPLSQDKIAAHKHTIELMSNDRG